LDFIHKQRRKIKQRFEKYLNRIEGVRVISETSEEAETSWFGVPILCDSPELKTKLLNYFEENRIQTRHYFAGNILQHPAYRDYGDANSYPNASNVLKNVFFIGCSPSLNENAINYVENKIIDFIK